MKRLFTLITTVLLCVFQTSAQGSQQNDTLAIDTTSVSNEAPTLTKMEHSISWTERSFDEPVYHYMLLDQSSEYEAFIFSTPRKVLVNKNRIEMYKRGSNTKLWEKSYDANAAMYRMTQYGVLEVRANKVQMLNYETGKKIWSLGTSNYSGLVGDIWLDLGAFGILQGRSLETGKKLWSSNISYEGGLCYSQILDDTHDFLVTDNIYKIDWTDGSHIHLKAKTSIANKGAIALAAVGALAGAAVGVAAGSSLIYIPDFSGYSYNSTHNGIKLPASGLRVSGIASPVLEDHGRYYFADRNSVICFDGDMNVFWDIKSPGDKASRSELLVRDNKLYMVNLGFAYKNGRQKELGIPYISAMNTSDGAQIFYEELADEKNMITQVCANDDEVRMLFNDMTISTLTFNDNKIYKCVCDTAKYGRPLRFVNRHKYMICSKVANDVYSDGSNENAYSMSFIPLSDLTDISPITTSNGYCLDLPLETGEPKVICSDFMVYSIVHEWNGTTMLRGGDGRRELWWLIDGEPELVNKDVQNIWAEDNHVTVLTTEGKIINMVLEIKK